MVYESDLLYGSSRPSTALNGFGAPSLFLFADIVNEVRICFPIIISIYCLSHWNMGLG